MSQYAVFSEAPYLPPNIFHFFWAELSLKQFWWNFFLCRWISRYLNWDRSVDFAYEIERQRPSKEKFQWTLNCEAILVGWKIHKSCCWLLCSLFQAKLESSKSKWRHISFSWKEEAKNAKETVIKLGGSFDLVVKVGDSQVKGCEFKSQHRILDGHLFTLICWKNCSSVCLKRPIQ